MTTRDQTIEATFASMVDALRAIVHRGSDCDYDLEHERPRPCPCVRCTALHALRLVEDWRYMGARWDRTQTSFNPREAALAAAWKRHFTLIGGGHADFRLHQILADSEYEVEHGDRPSPRDWYVASSVVQWLATNVGSSILEQAGWSYRHYDSDRRAMDVARHDRDRGVTRETIEVVSALLVDSSGQNMLMGKRRVGKRRGEMWEHPGGKVEAGESRQDALVRELREELGVEAVIGPSLARTTIAVEAVLHLTLYSVTLAEGSPPPSAIDHERLAWVTPEHAVMQLACTPATYAWHDQVVDFMAGRGKGR